jgi:hypothetical protein
MEPDEKYEFLVSDYYATGEGRSISILVTRAYPSTTEYDDAVPSGFIDGEFVMPTLKEGITSMTIATREFVEIFGSYMAMCMESFSREEFLRKYGRFLPDHVRLFLENKDQDDAGNFLYYSKYHINFS